MILIPCPFCGSRNASEFKWCGELRTRPDPNQTDPAEWREYLYLRQNAAGWSMETWFHRAGCRAYFTAERNTVTNEIRATYVSPRQPIEVDPPAQAELDTTLEAAPIPVAMERAG